MLTQEIINVASNSKTSNRERKLSNFSADRFLLGGQQFMSVEGFIQGIKYSPTNPIRKVVFALTGRDAKRYSLSRPPKYIQWEGQQIAYGSLEHHKLEAAAIFSKFDQNDDAQEALLATGNLLLRHETGYHEKNTTSLPKEVFTEILNETREAVFAEFTPYQPLEAPKYVTAGIVQYARGQADISTLLKL